MSSVGLASPADNSAVLTWRAEMKRAIRCPDELCRRLNLPSTWADQARQAAHEFPLFVPEPFLARMVPGDPHDPLLRQVLPLEAEQTTDEDYSRDPVGDCLAQARPGLIQKYDGRVLMIASGACAVHCRYCFRRHFPYHEAPHDLQGWQQVLAELEQQSEISELIFSGGDPLTLTDRQLESLLEMTHRVSHLSRVRIHTRLPVVIPARVTPRLVRMLSRLPATPIVVIHVNHGREIDESVERAIRSLVEAGVMVLNQAVLLRGVNDTVADLQVLSERLLEARVMPYYLHQLDKVQGAAHFWVPEERGRELMRELRSRLPGYAVPRYVQDLPGQPSKQILA